MSDGSDLPPDLIAMSDAERIALRAKVGDRGFHQMVREQTRAETMAGGRANWLAKRNPPPPPDPIEAPKPAEWKPRETPLTPQEIMRMTPAQRLELHKRAAAGLVEIMAQERARERGGR